MTSTSNFFITVLGEFVDDLEKVRIANDNRIRAMEMSDESGDLTESYAYERVSEIAKGIKASEVDAIKALEQAMKQHPLGGWVVNTNGIGLKTSARFLASIGDFDRFPNVAKLWAYCGYHVIDGQAPKRTKGQKSNWSTKAKMRAYLMAESCIKSKNSPYRKVYDEARTKHENAIHVYKCVRCGPSGSPAQPGSSLSKGHQHARAMREVAKEIIKDMWAENKRFQ